MQTREEILTQVLLTGAKEAIAANLTKMYMVRDFINVLAYDCPKGKTALYFCKCANCVDTLEKLTLQVREQYQIDDKTIELGVQQVQ